MEKYGLSIILGLIAGLVARLVMMRSDIRQYPGYPHGYVSHIALGFIAAGLGAVATPAMLDKNFVAVTFLALAAQQFRDVRNLERQSLEELEESELIPRGKDFIEGIARVFESRNYLVIGTALVTSSVELFLGWPFAIAAAVVCIILSIRLMRGNIIGDIADVVPAEVHFKDALLMVDKIIIMNIGLKDMREKIKQVGLGVLIKPKNDNGRATLSNIGQRQAIAHVASTVLGTKKDVDVPEFTPVLRTDMESGMVGFYIVPAEKDINILVEAVKQVPVLESARRKPLQSKLGKIASD